MFTTHDHEFIESTANRIIELGPNGMIDKDMTYDEYIMDERVKEQQVALYGGVVV